VPEDQHIEVGEALAAAALTSGRGPGLVHQREAHAPEHGVGHLGQPFAQHPVVVVAVDAD
jgi:hypothetical protein